jgi:Leucine-rich repeat (LRR) protein
LYNNSLQRFPSEAFSDLPNLEYFDLYGNKIKKIDRCSFGIFQRDEAKILLGGNQIVDVDVGAFENFTSQNASISLTNNLIESLPKGLFDNNMFLCVDLACKKFRTTAKDLCLRNCSIRYLLIICNNYWAEGFDLSRSGSRLRGLHSVSFTTRTIHFLNVGQFSFLVKLGVSNERMSCRQRKNIVLILLFFGTCRCTDFQRVMINCSVGCKDQNVSYERRDIVMASEGSSWITINNCDLKKLCKSLFNVSATGLFLFMTQCQIEEIEINFLNGLGIWSQLSVSFNPVEILRRYTFANDGIQIINLSSNKIRTIENEAFINLPNISEIDLQNNLLQRLTPEYFSNVPN